MSSDPNCVFTVRKEKGEIHSKKDKKVFDSSDLFLGFQASKQKL